LKLSVEGSEATRESRPCTAIDLFAGAGGATEGLKRAGFQVVAAVEIDSDAIKSYKANHRKVRMLHQDIRDVDVLALRDELNLQRGELSLLKACPPCQGFSKLGRMDREDPRNDLTLEIWKFVREFLPASILLENVPGLRSDDRYQLLVRQIRGLGYTVKTFTVDASDFGVPQRRRRLIVIGVRDSKASERLSKVTAIPERKMRRSHVSGPTLNRAARFSQPGDPLNVFQSKSAKTLARIEAIPVGGNRFDLPAELVLPCHAKLKNRNATGSYGRIRANEPSPTMTTRCTTPSCGPFIHPTQNRGLTLREAALLQTFPLKYIFKGGYGSIERQIGNAVPVRMAKGLGKIVRELVDDDFGDDC
jgi:DNA (cytosine-5)-methyltransferase 1